MIAFRPLLLLLIPTLALIRDPRPALGAEAVRIGFEDLSKRVLEHNQHVEAGQSLLSAAEASRGHLARSYLPRVTATGGYEAFRHGALGRMAQPYGELSATVSLFRGGRDMLEERARSGRVELAGAEAQQILLEELTKARKEFWSLVYQREVVAYLKDAVAQNERNLASARKRYRAGIGTETDRSEFEISGVQLAQDLARLELSIARSQRNLGALIGLPTETLIETESAIDHEHSDEIFSARLDTASHREVRAVAARAWLSTLPARGNRWFRAREGRP
jgi:outer membrane protein TolC